MFHLYSFGRYTKHHKVCDILSICHTENFSLCGQIQSLYASDWKYLMEVRFNGILCITKNSLLHIFKNFRHQHIPFLIMLLFFIFFDNFFVLLPSWILPCICKKKRTYCNNVIISKNIYWVNLAVGLYAVFLGCYFSGLLKLFMQ